MKRKRIAGLCLVAVFALGAMFAAAGSASAAEYKWCQPQKKGEYTNSTCTTKSSKPKKGKFEIVPVQACAAQKKGEYTTSSCTTKSSKPKKGKFEKTTGRKFTTTTGTASLETPKLGGTIECASSEGTGEITGPKTATEQVDFHECQTKKLPCSNVAGKADIVTFQLHAVLIGHGEKGPGGKIPGEPRAGEEPLSGEVWTNIAGEGPGGLSSAFGCEKTGFIRTGGTLSGVDGGANLGKLASSGTTDFELGIGEQNLETEASAEESFGTFAGPFYSTERTLGTVVGEKPTEIKP
jgi:hypothetical protein